MILLRMLLDADFSTMRWYAAFRRFYYALHAICFTQRAMPYKSRLPFCRRLPLIVSRHAICTPCLLRCCIDTISMPRRRYHDAAFHYAMLMPLFFAMRCQRLRC